MVKLFRRKKHKERRFWGCTLDDMEAYFFTLCNMESDMSLTEQEAVAIARAIHCMTQIMNLMEGGKRIEWDN